MRLFHTFAEDSARFDDDNLVSVAGLVPVMTLAEQTGLSSILADKVAIGAPRIASGAANPAPKLVTLIAGMCAGADSIDDVDVLRSGGMGMCRLKREDPARQYGRHTGVPQFEGDTGNRFFARHLCRRTVGWSNQSV